MQNRREELHKELENHEEAKTILKHIDCVDEMIIRDNYDKDKVIEIEDEYSVESKFLLGFENPFKIGFENNQENPEYQVLKNLRDRLYLTAVYKVLKEQGKEIPKDFVKKDYPELINLIEKE